jgi:hypothetical protein
VPRRAFPVSYVIRGFECEGAYDWGGGFLSVAGFINGDKDLATNAPLYSVAPGRITTTLAFRFLDNALTVAGRGVAGDACHGAPRVAVPSDDGRRVRHEHNRRRHLQSEMKRGLPGGGLWRKGKAACSSQ